MAGTREIAQRNGLLGGRPKGSKTVPFAVKAAIQERFRQRGIELADELLAIALNHKNFAPTRVAAIEKIFDRTFGRPEQPVTGAEGGPITIQVITGVPEPD